jgi:hypothetical protein
MRANKFEDAFQHLGWQPRGEVGSSRRSLLRIPAVLGLFLAAQLAVRPEVLQEAHDGMRDRPAVSGIRLTQRGLSRA